MRTSLVATLRQGSRLQLVHQRTLNLAAAPAHYACSDLLDCDATLWLKASGQHANLEALDILNLRFDDQRNASCSAAPLAQLQQLRVSHAARCFSTS